MKILTTRTIRKSKLSETDKSLQVLTCYDYQTAQLLNSTAVDMILVGDSLGNVILGYDTTIEVSVEEMKIFGAAVKRGAPDKFTIVDMPFGSYSTLESAISNANDIYKATKAQALKLEGAYPYQLEIISRLTQTGIPIMGHIGLTPQSVNEQGGYYTHGKDQDSRDKLLAEAKALEEAGCFAIVLECVTKEIAQDITNELSIPTIGIGAGTQTDGQVLVINDLLKMGPGKYPSFCKPIANLYNQKEELLEKYLKDSQSIHKTKKPSNGKSESVHH